MIGYIAYNSKKVPTYYDTVGSEIDIKILISSEIKRSSLNSHKKL